jgi:phage replication O-like protein O
VSEKLKPNFTPVPNIIFDERLRTLTPGAVKVLFAICRYTYGWGRQSDRISLKQLSEMTGIKDRGNVHRAIKQLGNLVTVKPGDPSKNQASEYALNIEIPDSELLSLQSAHSKKGKPTRRNAPDPALIREFDAWYAVYPKHVGREPALKAWSQINPDRALVETIMTATARYANAKDGIEQRFILDPATWLNQKRWNDELPAVGTNGYAKPAEVKDLGDGLVEVDGRRMEKRLYERRFASGAN